MERQDLKKKKYILAILKLIALIGIVVLVPLYIYVYHKDFITSLSDLESAKSYFENNMLVMTIVYVLFQALQIVISIIPGQWLQIAAGYFYGIAISYALSIVGAIIGTVVAYYLAKKLGRDAVHLIFGEERIKHVIKRLNSKKAMIIIFLIFLIPGAPKDLCTYAAGISEIKLKPFLVVSLLGRSPGMLGSIIIGQQLNTGSYMGAIVVAIVAIIAFALCVIYRKRINEYLDRIYDKYIEE